MSISFGLYTRMPKPKTHKAAKFANSACLEDSCELGHAVVCHLTMILGFKVSSEKESCSLATPKEMAGKPKRKPGGK